MLLPDCWLAIPNCRSSSTPANSSSWLHSSLYLFAKNCWTIWNIGTFNILLKDWPSIHPSISSVLCWVNSIHYLTQGKNCSYLTQGKNCSYLTRGKNCSYQLIPEESTDISQVPDFEWEGDKEQVRGDNWRWIEVMKTLRPDQWYSYQLSWWI